MNMLAESNLAPHQFDSSIVRAYDVRGIVGKTLTTTDAFYFGKSVASYIFQSQGKNAVTIAVAFDGRLSSPDLATAMMDGIMSTGADAVNIGLGPSPMLYFAVHHEQLDGGIMITGSHNPPEYNGFKTMIGKASLFGDELKKVTKLAETGDLKEGKGVEIKKDVTLEYVDALLSGYTTGGRELKVAWDAGNGAAGKIMSMICQQLPGEHILLNEKIDGTFPSHHPDPTQPENLKQLIETVKREDCYFGIAFDGDGDRIGAVDAEGRIIWGDQLLQFYAEDVLAEYPGTPIIADVKASQTLFDRVAQLGGKPVMYKTGHSLIKSHMKETGAKLAGEMSGHIFFADDYFGFDDGLYAAVRLLNIAAHADASITEMVDGLPNTFATQELRIDCPDDIKFDIPKKVEAQLKADGADVNAIDGVRVNTGDGWWLLRASNTQACLVARCEAGTKAALADTIDNLKKYVEPHGVIIPV